MDFRAFYLRNNFWFHDWLKGSPIRKSYKEVEFILTHSKEEGWPIRSQKLRHILDYASEHCEFYKDLKGHNIEDFPVMTKTSLIENHDKIVVPEKDIPGQEGPVFIQRTSGSTGNPLAMPQDTGKRQRRIAEIKFLSYLLGYNSHEKMVHLRTWNSITQKPSTMKRRDNIVPFDIKRLGDDDLVELCQLIQKEKAVYVRGYASTFDKINKIVNRHHFKFPHLKLIVCTSEALEDDLRKATREAMKCEVVSQYADEECGVLAQERIPTKEKDNVMYFNWSGYYIEILKLNEDKPVEYGELGRIVLTDFHNHAFPVIRYDTGDTCVLLPPDEYSNGYPVMGKLYGRRFDLTYTTNGTPIYPLAYGRLLKNYDTIQQWQFVQEGEKKYCLNLVLRNMDQKEVPDMLLNIRELLGDDADISINLVDEIPLMRSGKRKPVKNDWLTK